VRNDPFAFPDNSHPFSFRNSADSGILYSLHCFFNFRLAFEPIQKKMKIIGPFNHRKLRLWARENDWVIYGAILCAIFIASEIITIIALRGR